MTSFVINQFGHGDTCRAFSQSDLSGAVGSTKPGADQSMSTFFSFLIEIYYLNVIDVQTGNATIFFHKDSPAIWFLCTYRPHLSVCAPVTLVYRPTVPKCRLRNANTA